VINKKGFSLVVFFFTMFVKQRLCGQNFPTYVAFEPRFKQIKLHLDYYPHNII